MSAGRIDLGVVGDPREDPGRPVPGRWWWRRSRSGRWLPAALAVLLALPLAAAAAPAPPTLVPLWTAPGTAGNQPAPTRYAVGAQSFYLTAPKVGSGWTLTAHRLGDGALRWEAPLDGIAHEAAVRMVGGVPVVTTRGPLLPTTLGFDPGSGRLRWHHAGAPVGPGGDPLLLRRERPSAALASGDTVAGTLVRRELPPAEPTTELVAVDPATGAVAWTRRVGDGRVRIHRGDGLPFLVTLGDDGRLSRYDLGTGEVGATTATRRPSRDWNPRLVGGLVLLRDLTGEGRLAAYDADTLTLRWTLPHATGVVGCGPVLCVDVGGGRLHALDPVTGTVRWSQGCTGAAGGSCYLSAGTFGAGGPVWVLRSSGSWDPKTGGETSRPTSSVVDAGTGRLISDLGGWRPTWRLEGPVWGGSGPRGGPFSGVTGEAGQVRLARVDLAGAGVTVLGSFQAQWWQAHGRYVVTWEESAGMRVWRIG